MTRTVSRVFRTTALATLICAAANAQYSLDWYTIDGGGVTFSSGGSFELSGTIGQPDAGVMAGGPFELVGGFWGGVIEPAVCLGDADHDGDVDVDDLLQVLGDFGNPGPSGSGDTDGDGDTDVDDLLNVLANFSLPCP